LASLVKRSSAAGEEMLGALRKLLAQTVVAVTVVPTAPRPSRQRLKTFWMRIQNLLHLREGKSREKGWNSNFWQVIFLGFFFVLGRAGS